MFKEHKKVKSLVSVIFICSFYYASNVFSNHESTVNNSTEYLQENSPELFEKALEQLKKIDFMLEKLAQAINSGQVKVKEKDNARDYIEKTRAIIDKILVNSVFNHLKLININNALIKNISAVINSNFSSAICINEFHLLDYSDNSSSVLNLHIAHALLIANDKELNNLISKFKSIGINKLNLFVQGAEKLVKNSVLAKKAKFTIKRSLPYMGLATYLLYMNRKASVEKLPLIGKFLGKIKTKLGTIDSVDKVEVEVDVKKGKSKIQKDVPHIENGYLHTIHKYVSDIVEIDKGHLFKLSVGAIMLPIIKKDVQDLAGWSYERFEDIMSILKGEFIKDRSAVKKSKLNFNSIAGYNSVKKQLNNIVDYFKNKDLLDLVGQKAPSCYLISGGLDISSELINALAGEINKVISDKNSKKFCGIYNITASELVDKKAKDIISKIEDAQVEHCVILLSNLDWLYIHGNNKVKVWENLTELLRTVKDKKQISIFATIKNTNLLDKPIRSLFDGAIRVNKPNESDIKEFLIKTLKDRCIQIVNFDLDTLVQEIKKLSFSDIQFILNNAFTNAYLNQRILSQEDIEQAIVNFKS